MGCLEVDHKVETNQPSECFHSDCDVHLALYLSPNFRVCQTFYISPSHSDFSVPNYSQQEEVQPPSKGREDESPFGNRHLRIVVVSSILLWFCLLTISFWTDDDYPEALDDGAESQQNKDTHFQTSFNIYAAGNLFMLLTCFFALVIHALGFSLFSPSSTHSAHLFAR